MIAFVVSVDSWRALRGALVGDVRRARRHRARRRARGCRASCTRSSTSGANASAPTSGPRSPRTCTTRCCRRSRSCSGGPTIRARSCGSHALQERELRGWLLGGGGPATDGPRPRVARRRARGARGGDRDRARRPVEVVRVRDCPLDGLEPLLLAAREAIVNAVAALRRAAASRCTSRSSPNGRRSSCATAAGASTRAGVPADRGGITNSIVGRMTRAGGRADVRSHAGRRHRGRAGARRGRSSEAREP